MTEGNGVARPTYHRVLLKLSGDAFAPADSGYGIDTSSTALLARQLAEVVDLGVQTAVVVGGGNIWRGRQAPGIDRSRADYMGMLATVMNALALQDALEIKADAILKGTKVDGVYTADPHVDPTATRFETIEYIDVLREGYAVMDATAISLCMENKLPIVVFDFGVEGNIRRVVVGAEVGTLVHGGVA